MRFSRTAHLQICLSLETLTSIIRTGLTDRSGELCYNFSVSNDLTQMVNFPTMIPDFDSHSPALLDLLISSDASICSTVALPPLGNFDHVVVLFAFHHIHNGMPHFIALLVTIFGLIGMVFVII